jgi:hypothetical protein
MPPNVNDSQVLNKRRKILQTPEEGPKSTKPTPPAQAYEPPVRKPAVVDISREYANRPFLVESAVDWKKPEGWEEMSEEEQVLAIIGHNTEESIEDNFLVGIGRLKSKRIMAYSKRTGYTLEQHIMQIFQASAYEELGPALVPHVTYDPDTKRFHTEFGVMEGNSQSNAMSLVAYIMATFGVITGIDHDSKLGYTFAPVTEDEILEVLDPQVFTMIDSEGDSVFMTILELSGTYSKKKAIVTLEEQQAREDADKEHEEGKSLTPNDDGENEKPS